MPPNTSPNIHTVLTDPNWFLSALDIPNQSFVFELRDAGSFNAAPFHDGRTPFTDAATQTHVSFAEAARFAKTQSQQTPDRLILHQSFCGSTFLARALGACDRTTVYREPQVLVEFSTMRGLSRAPLSKVMPDKAMFDFILSQFRKTNRGEIQTIIKPSNWANEAFGLCDLGRAKIIIAPITQHDYFIANIRGGQARIKYSLDLLNHLLRFDPNAQAVVQSLNNDKGHSPMEAMLMMLAVAHALQKRILETIAKRHPAKNIHNLAPDWLSETPTLIDTITGCADFLALDYDAAETKKRLSPLLRKNAKTESGAFDSQAQDAANNALAQAYAGPIAKAKDWAERHSFS